MVRQIVLVALLGVVGLPLAWAGRLPDQLLTGPDSHCSLGMLEKLIKNNELDRLKDVRHLVCGLLPGRPELALVVYLSPANVPAEAASSYETDDVGLAAVNAATGEVLAAGVVRGGFQATENFAFAALALDEGTYRLAPGQWAFGLRITATHAHGPHMGAETDLALYQVRGRQIVPVMPAMPTRLLTASQSSACPGGRSVNEAAFDEDRVSLRTLDIASHGLADLEATVVRTRSAGGLTGGDCRPVPPPARVRRHVLHFDGRQYALPPELRPPERGNMSPADLLQLPGRAR